MLFCDNYPTLCRANNKTPVLPREAYLPINRCNLPAVILGSPTSITPRPCRSGSMAWLSCTLTYFAARTPPRHQPSGRTSSGPYDRALSAGSPEDAGYNATRGGWRGAHYISVLRGWSVNADSREGAVLKGWVESRFGLTLRFHGEPLRDSRRRPTATIRDARRRFIWHPRAGSPA